MADVQNEKPLSTGEWLVTELVLLIPLINFVMLFVWAFSDGNISRRNFCRARLLLFAIAVGLAFVVGIILVVFTGVFAGILNQRLR